MADVKLSEAISAEAKRVSDSHWTDAGSVSASCYWKSTDPRVMWDWADRVKQLERERDELRSRCALQRQEIESYAGRRTRQQEEIARLHSERDAARDLLGRMLAVAADEARRMLAEAPSATERAAAALESTLEDALAGKVRPNSPLMLVRREMLDQLRQRAEQAERERDALSSTLGFDGPWPLHSVLEKLADAADHLLRDHCCDSHGYEEVCAARDSARRIAKRLLEGRP